MPFSIILIASKTTGEIVMINFIKNLLEKNDEGFNFNPRKHSTLTVYKNGQYCTYVFDKRTHKVLA